MVGSKLATDSDTFRVFKGFPPATGEQPGSAEKALAGSEIDVYALAVEVYALLEQELRLENERLVRRQPW